MRWKEIRNRFDDGVHMTTNARRTETTTCIISSSSMRIQICFQFSHRILSRWFFSIIDRRNITPTHITSGCFHGVICMNGAWTDFIRIQQLLFYTKFVAPTKDAIVVNPRFCTTHNTLLESKTSLFPMERPFITVLCFCIKKFTSLRQGNKGQVRKCDFKGRKRGFFKAEPFDRMANAEYWMNNAVHQWLKNARIGVVLLGAFKSKQTDTVITNLCTFICFLYIQQPRGWRVRADSCNFL